MASDFVIARRRPPVLRLCFHADRSAKPARLAVQVEGHGRSASTPALQFDRDLVPVHFLIQGDTARLSTIDAEVTLAGGMATIREGSASRREPAPAGAFTLAGYAPPSVQMALMQYWAAHGRPASVPLLPHGTARIELRGRDAVAAVNGDGGPATVTLDRYSVGGIVWGRETLWCDATGRLAALVSVDAEFDHFEAARPEFKSAVPQLVPARRRTEWPPWPRRRPRRVRRRVTFWRSPAARSST